MIAGNPFVGLRPFDRGDAHLFFGRDDQLDALTTRLGAQRLVAVLGSSGAGKSSLVRAGLLPALEGGLVPGIGSSWAIAVMTPGANPIGNLAVALASVFEPQSSMRAEQLPYLEAVLRRGALGLVDAVRESPLGSRPLFILVDQFEEIFRFKHIAQASGDHDHASAFVKLLLEAVKHETPAVYVMLTMRSEFLGNTSEFHDLPEAINDGLFLIPRLTRDQLTEAITGPVAVGKGRIAPSLVQRLLNDVGDDADQLPVLQHALMRTWEEWRRKGSDPSGLTIEHYEATKGLSGALSEHADEAFLELNPRQQKIAGMFFKALTERGTDGRDVRRPTRVRELAAVAGVSVDEVIAVADRFRSEGRSFLMPSGAAPIGPDTVLDISHESLMRKWSRLRDWVAEEAEDRRIFLRLSDSAALYSAGQEPLLLDPRLTFSAQWRTRFAPTDAWARRYAPNLAQSLTYLDTSVAARQREVRRRRLRLVTVVFALIVTAVGVLWDVHRRQDERERDAAERARITQENEKGVLQRKVDELEREKRLADAVRRGDDLEKAGAAQRIRDEREAQRLAISFVTQMTQSEPNRSEEAALVALQALVSARRSNNQEAVSYATNALTNALGLLPVVRLSDSVRGPVRSIAASRDNLVVRDGVSGRGSVHLWRMVAPKPVVGRPPPVDDPSPWTSTGTRTVWITGHTLRVWDAESGEALSLDLPAAISMNQFSRMVLSPDGKFLLLGKTAGVDLWNLATRTMVPLESTTTGPMIFAGNGQTIVTAVNGAIHLWTLTGTRLGSDITVTGTPARLAIDTGGTWLAATSFGSGTVPQLTLWCIVRDGSGGAQVSAPGPIALRNMNATDFAFSSKGFFAWGNDDGAAVISKLSSPDASKAPKLTNPYEVRHAGGTISRVLFSPDGSYLATAGSDRTARLWSSADLSSARAVPNRWTERVRVSHQAPVNAIAFLAEGTLATADVNGGVRVSAVPEAAAPPKTSDDLITMACARVSRTLTADEWILFFRLAPYEAACQFKLDPHQVLELETAYAQGGNKEQARESAKTLAALRGTGGVPEFGLDRLMAAAVAEAKVDNADLAREHLAKAVRIAEAVRDPKQRADVENELCWQAAIGGLATGVLKTCDEASGFDPKNIDYLTTRAIAYAKAGDSDTARRLFIQAVDLSGKDTSENRGHENNAVCWRGAIYNFARDVRPACDTAVSTSPTEIAFLDSQGIAYALIGTPELLKKALTNFKEFVKRGEEYRPGGILAKREGWVHELEQGRNPFKTETQKVLDDLAKDLANELRLVPSQFSKDR